MKKRRNRIFTLLAGVLGVLTSWAQPYSLEDVQRLALENNRVLKNARIEMQAADADKDMAYTKYFPTASASVMGFAAAKEIMRPELDLKKIVPGLPDWIQTTYGMDMLKSGALANIMVAQPIYAGGQIVNGNKLAALQQEIRKLQYGMTEKQILQSVTEYYWQLASLDANAKTIEAAQAQLVAVHELTENFVDAGVINRNDLLTVELKQQELQSDHLQVDNARELMRMLLAQLCGRADSLQSFTLSLSPLTRVTPPDSVFVSPAKAVLDREELQLAGKAVAAKDLQYKMERGKLLPTVAVGAAGMYDYMHLKGYFKDMSNFNLIGFATVNIPITDWWGGKHSLKKAKLQWQQAENDRQEAQEKLQVDILAAWNNLTEAYAQIEIAKKSVVSAAENLRLQMDQYRAGTSLMSDLLNAVTLDVKAQSSLTSAQAKYQSRLADYRRKTGR